MKKNPSKFKLNRKQHEQDLAIYARDMLHRDVEHYGGEFVWPEASEEDQKDWWRVNIENAIEGMIHFAREEDIQLNARRILKKINKKWHGGYKYDK